jgi:hypothetical protein
MAVNPIVSVEPHPTIPGAGIATLADGTQHQDLMGNIAPYYQQQQSAAPTPTPMPTPAPLPQGPAIAPAPTVDDQLYAYGAAASGATPQDFARAKFLGVPVQAVVANKHAVPGAPEISQRTIAKMLPMPSAKQVVTEGARPIDEPALEHTQDLQREAADAQARAQIAEGDASTRTAQVQARAATYLQDKQEDLQTRQESDFRARYTQLSQEAAGTAAEMPDSQRWFKQHGAIGTVFAIVGGMMSDFAQGLAGNPGGPSALEQFVNQDIAMQERAIERKGAAANNRLAQLSQEWGSLAAGRAALQVGQYTTMQTQLNALAAQNKNVTLQPKIAAVQAELEAQIAEKSRVLHAEALGNTKIAETDQFVMPHRANAGGYRYDVAGAINTAQNMQKPELEAQKENQKGAGDIASEMQQLTAAKDAVLESARLRGLEFDPHGKDKFEAPKNWDDQLHGIYDAPVRNWAPDAWAPETAKIAHGVKIAGLAVHRSLHPRAPGSSGGELPGGIPSDTYTELLYGTTQAVVPDSYNAVWRNLENREAEIRAGQSPGAVHTHDVNLQRQRAEQAQGNRREAAEQRGFTPRGLKQ